MTTSLSVEISWELRCRLRLQIVMERWALRRMGPSRVHILLPVDRMDISPKLGSSPKVWMDQDPRPRSFSPSRTPKMRPGNTSELKGKSTTECPGVSGLVEGSRVLENAGPGNNKAEETFQYLQLQGCYDGGLRLRLDVGCIRLLPVHICFFY